jgi:hypothetical protein
MTTVAFAAGTAAAGTFASSIPDGIGADESNAVVSAVIASIVLRPQNGQPADRDELGMIKMNGFTNFPQQQGSQLMLVQDMHLPVIRSSATLSRCRQYRYTLTRTWDSTGPTVVFVGLNPSTADAKIDDPTVRRCIGFARSWGFGKLILTNLFAFRSTDPNVLEHVADPIGPKNDQWIASTSEVADLTVVAWGIHGGLQHRDQVVLELLREPHCLGTTKSGAPRHPLYLPANAPLKRFSSCGIA